MGNTNFLKKFVTDDQILECLILFDKSRKMEASKLLAYYMLPKKKVTTLEAYNLLQGLYNE